MKNLEEQIKLIKQKIEEKEQAEYLAKDIAARQFEVIQNKFKELVEKNIFEACKFLNLMSSSLGLDLEKSPENNLQLKSSPKENLPGEAKGDFITNKKYFDEVLKFGKSFLSKEAFQRITSGIKWNSKAEVVQGSKPEFIILCGDYDIEEFGKSRTLSAYQTWKNHKLIKNKFWVDMGYYLNGTEVNSQVAKHFINQFKDFGIIENSEDFIPIKIDLFGLTFNKNPEGLIYLTGNSIFAQTEELQNGNYTYSELAEYGIPIKSTSGKTNYVPSGKGFYRCFLDWNSDLYSRVVNLSISVSDGRVVRKVA